MASSSGTVPAIPSDTIQLLDSYRQIHAFPSGEEGDNKFDEWRLKAVPVVVDTLQALANQQWHLHEDHVATTFPETELKQLRDSLNMGRLELLRGGEPLLEDLDFDGYNLRVEKYDPVEKVKGDVPLCARVMIDKELALLGHKLCGITHGIRYKVRDYINFRDEAHWGTLRQYLLRTLVSDWKTCTGVLRCAILRDLVLLRYKVSEDKLTVIQLWKILKDEYDSTVNEDKLEYKYIVHMCRRRRAQHNGGGIRFPDVPASHALGHRSRAGLTPRKAAMYSGCL